MSLVELRKTELSGAVSGGAMDNVIVRKRGGAVPPDQEIHSG